MELESPSPAGAENDKLTSGVCNWLVSFPESFDTLFTWDVTFMLVLLVSMVLLLLLEGDLVAVWQFIRDNELNDFFLTPFSLLTVADEGVEKVNPFANSLSPTSVNLFLFWVERGT